MDKRTALALVIFAIVIITGIAILFNINQQTNPDGPYEAPVPVTASMKDTYINFPDGTPSEIFLVDSNATFGTFASDYRDESVPPDMDKAHEARRGDRFVDITGTIRNDYVSDKDYYIALVAHVYDTKGEPIGTIVRTNGRPEFLASYLGLATNESGSFRILLKCESKYELKDIKKYDIALAWAPGPTPPP